MKQAGLPPDTHVHTYLCKHANGEPSEYAARAYALGLAAIGFTDHAPAPDGYDAANRMTVDETATYRRLVGEAGKQAPLPIFYGIEADHYAGCRGFLERWLPDQGFDMVLGSVHYISDWAFDNPAQAATWDSVDRSDAWRRYFNLVAELADSRLFDVVAHLDLPKKFGHRIADAELTEIAAPALDRIADAGMAVELNTSGLRRAVREIYPSPVLLAMAHDRGIPVVFGSDAHLPEHVGHEFGKAVALARQAGYNQYAVYTQRRRRMAPLPGAAG